MRIAKRRQPGMGRRSAVATAVAAGVTALGLGACGEDEGLTERTLRFTEGKQLEEASVDNPPRGGQDQISPADTAVFVKELLDNAGQPAGAAHGVCAATQGGDDPTISCDGILELDDGTLSFNETAHLREDRSRTAAITGGTGAYEGATGELNAGKEYEVHIFLP